MGTSADSIAQVVKGADIVLVALGSDEKMARETMICLHLFTGGTREASKKRFIR